MSINLSLITSELSEWIDTLSLYSNIPKENIQEDFKDAVDTNINQELCPYCLIEVIKASIFEDIEKQTSGFLFCYKTGKEAEKIYNALISLNLNLNYNILQLLNESDIPYPHVILISLQNLSDLNKLDIILSKNNFPFGNVDTYTLSHRLHEIIEMTIIKGARYELKRPQRKNKKQ